MTDYISRDALLEALRKNVEHLKEQAAHLESWDNTMIGARISGMEKAIMYVETEPKADVVEVVRCGECIHMSADGRCMVFADDAIRPSAEDFCSYGERKGGDTE